ncbi:MAG: hypothetical protein KBF93_24340 [Leptospiraceae bacterium]|nr:hypothetical protein [Leptospiraceae bacterium]
MNYKKITLLLFTLLLILNCGKTIIKLNDPASKQEGIEPDYKKKYASNWIGLQEYSKPVTPNKPQAFRSTWFTSKAEKEQHINPVCANNVDTVVIYPDFVDSAIHFFLGGITSTRTVLIYCNK